MEEIILLIQVIAAISLIILVLIQQGKGAEAGASFGTGASQTFFGSQGSGSFITRLTAIMAIIFFASTLALGYLSSHRMLPQNLDTFLEQGEPVQEKVVEKPGVSDIPNIPQPKQ